MAPFICNNFHMKNHYIDVIYCRVSTLEQKETGRSIVDQESKCQRYSQENSGSPIRVFVDDGYSGSSQNRPGLKELLLFCQENDVDRVIVVDTDRIARSTNDHFAIKAILKKHGVALVSINQPMIDDSPEGNLLDGILASVNAFYPQVTGRKTSNTMYEKAISGWFPGPARLGYMNHHDPTKPKGQRNTIIPHPVYGSLVTTAFELFAAGQYTIYTLADEMQKRGLLSINGEPVTKTSVRKMLGDEFYLGRFHYRYNKGKDEVFIKNAKHQPLTDEETFNRCQIILAQHNKSADRKRKHQFLLNGCLICPECGRPFTASKQKVRQKDYYHCPAQHNKSGQYIPVEEMDKAVKELFQGVQLPDHVIEGTLKEARRILNETHGDVNEKRRQLLVHQKALEDRRDSIEIKYSDDKLTFDAYKRQSDKIEADLTEVSKELISLNDTRANNIQEMEQLLLLSRDIYRAFKEAPYELKRNYLALFWDRIEVKDKKILEATPSLLFQAILPEPTAKAGNIPAFTSVLKFSNWLPG
jgi:site-specific DNA recombinase